MVLKLFSLGGVIIGPMVGILMEAVVAELVLSLGSQPRRSIFLLTGALGVTWTLLQPFMTNPLLFGRSIFTAWLDLLDRGSQLFGVPANAWLWIILVLLVIHLAVGTLAGWLSWDFGRKLKVRLGKSE